MSESVKRFVTRFGSFLDNRNDPLNVHFGDREYSPVARRYLRLASMPSGSLTIHALRDALGVNGAGGHPYVVQCLQEVEDAGFIKFDAFAGSNRTVYRITVNPLSDILPELESFEKKWQDKKPNITDSQQLLRYFSDLKEAKLGVREQQGPKVWRFSNQLLELTSLDRAKAAAKEYWSLAAENRKYNNFHEFHARFGEWLGRILEDEEVANQQSRRKAQKEYAQSPEGKAAAHKKWLEDNILEPINDEDLANLIAEYIELYGEEELERTFEFE